MKVLAQVEKMETTVICNSGFQNLLLSVSETDDPTEGRTETLSPNLPFLVPPSQSQFFPAFDYLHLKMMMMMMWRCFPDRSPSFCTFQRHVEPSHPEAPEERKHVRQRRCYRLWQMTVEACEKFHLVDNFLQFLSSVVAVDGEVAQLFPCRCLSLSQLIPKLVSLSVHLVSGTCYILVHRLAICLTGLQLHLHLDDGVLREKQDGRFHLIWVKHLSVCSVGLVYGVVFNLLFHGLWLGFM